MPKYNPSQYDCDNLEKGDMILIKERPWLEKLIRKLFFKDKIILKIKEGEKITYAYQEDCILMYAWDLLAVQVYDNKIPCMFSKNPNKTGYKTELIKSLRIGTLNMQIVFKDDNTLTIPMIDIVNAIDQNRRILKEIKDDRMIQESVKYLRYKGSYFKNYCSKYNITEWIPSYCYLCGEPVVFKFNIENDLVNIENKCTCGRNNLSLNKLSFDEFAIWYAGAGEDNKKYYNKFWFQERIDKNNE